MNRAHWVRFTNVPSPSWAWARRHMTSQVLKYLCFIILGCFIVESNDTFPTVTHGHIIYLIIQHCSNSLICIICNTCDDMWRQTQTQLKLKLFVNGFTNVLSLSWVWVWRHMTSEVFKLCIFLCYYGVVLLIYYMSMGSSRKCIVGLGKNQT